MSRSNPTADPIINPCKRWFQWDSTSKQLKWYDKDRPRLDDPSKKGVNIPVPLPFSFMVLDVLTTVAGFSDDEQSTFYSNEVRNYMGSTKTEVLSVKLKKQEVANGTWETIKTKIEAMGAKFAFSVYIAFFDENKVLQLGNIKLSGAPIGAWIELASAIAKSGKKIEECSFKIASTKAGKKGSVVWNEPVFEEIKVKPETEAKAVELDKVLQEFLAQYFAKASVPIATAPEPVAESQPVSSTPHTDALLAEDSAPLISNSGLPSDFDDEAF